MKIIQKLLTAAFAVTFINAINAQCDFTLSTLTDDYCKEGEITSVLYAGNTLSTTFQAGNAHRGNMFDITGVNEVIITGFDIHPQENTTIEVYYRPESYVGFEGASDGWVLINTADVVAKPSGEPTYLPLVLDVTIPKNETYGFYVTSSNIEVTLNYTDGTTEGAVYASDDNIQFHEGIGLDYPFGKVYNPRIFNGNIRYKLPENNYLWSDGSALSYLEVSPDVTTTYSVIVTDNLETCNASKEIEIETPFSLTTTEFCSNSGILSLGTVTISGGVFTGDGVTDNADGETFSLDTSIETGYHTVTYTYTNENGCAKGYDIQFSIIDAAASDNTISELTPGVLTANQSGAVTYQWYRCPNILLENETNQDFSPSESGDYKVVINANCNNLESSCYTYADQALGVSSFNLTTVKVYPNPVLDVLNITSVNGGIYKLFNQLGQLVDTTVIERGKTNHIDMSDFQSGIYLLGDQSGNVFKVIKK